jgi:iron(III) transport system ATP-binding protein
MPSDPDVSAIAPAAFLIAERIHKTFGSQMVLDHVGLEIPRGELVAILGPSGCGKTTLLRIIAGLERQNSGRILIENQDVSAAPPAARQCGIVFQSYALFPNLSVKQNIAFGMDRRRTTRAQRNQRVLELLDLIGLPNIAGRRPAQLSGGQQQRVALARALAVDPSILLLDEPLSALDAKVRARLRVEIRQIQQRLKLTTILVTHDQEEALTMADRVVVMDHGRILQVGTPWEIYRNPRHSTVGDFVGSMNLMPGWTTGGDGTISQNGTLLTHQSATGDPGTSVNIAFRPEDARLIARSESRPANSLAATIQRVEFRGAFCRVYLSTGAEPSIILVDAPLADANGSFIRAGSEVAVHVPADHVRVFRQDGSAL